MTWRQSDEGKKVIADGQTQANTKRARLSKEKVDGKKNDGGGGGGGGGTPIQRKKTYQNKVTAAAKKLLAASLEAEKVEADAMDIQVKASMQRVNLMVKDALKWIVVPICVF